MVRYTRKLKGGKRLGNASRNYLNAPIPNSTQASMNQKKANAEQVRKNALARCNTGQCSSANQYLADLTNTNILKMTRKQLNNAIASRNNVQKKYNQELANHQANRNLAAVQWAEYNANLQRTKNSLQSVEESYRIAKEKANKANLSNAERIAAEKARNNLQKKLNDERKNMNNAYARGAKLQENHNKAVSDLAESSKMLEDGYTEHLRIVGEKDDELKRKQEELDAALEKAGRANASNAQRNNALASVKTLQASVDSITAQLGDVEKEKAEKEEELRKQKEFMESEYKRGELLWKQKEDEISDLNDKLTKASNSEKAVIEKALADAKAAAAEAEKSKTEFEGKLNNLNSLLNQAQRKNEEQMRQITSLGEQLDDEKASAAAAAAAAEATLKQIKAQQALNKNASNAEKKQMQKSLDDALVAAAAAGAKLEQIKKEQAAADERARLLQESLAEAAGKKISSIKGKISNIKRATQELL